MTGFQGRRVVVTGAGGGVGRALTAAFAALGAEIVACDVAEPGGAEPGGAGIGEFHGFDLRDRAATLEAAAAIAAGGAPAAVILNAGWTRQETLAQATPEGIVAEMELNFTGAALLSHALLPAMRAASGDRAFVFVSSVNAVAHHGNPAYAAAKAGCLAWMRALAVEEGAHGIRANAVAPGSIRTTAWDRRLKEDPGLLERLAALYPLGRIVTADEVANAVTFLASPAASGITGATLNVDAGLLAGNLPFLEGIR